MDEYYKVAITRMGQHIRAAGTAEIGSWDTRVTPRDCATALKSLKNLYPQGADLAKVEYWAGLRPMTPDNMPIVGRLDERTLVATGHGRSGFLLAPWTAERIVAELLVGVAP
jgi:D-amino-acid dehydrogenase